MAGAFGMIVSGRMVETNFTTLSDNQFLATILDADNINHVVIFLTGITPLPLGTVGMVYFSWPDQNAPPNWQVVGYIANNKPSIIFKVSNLKKLEEIAASDNAFMGTFGQQKICHNAQIGISIEPEINGQMVTSELADREQKSYISFAQKMLENLFNYVASYSVTQEQMTPNPGVSYIPLNTLQTWYQNFERRLQQNPSFWKTI